MGKRSAPEILFSHLMEGIGLALDPKGGRMFVTDFAGSVYSANLDGSNQQTLSLLLLQVGSGRNRHAARNQTLTAAAGKR